MNLEENNRILVIDDNMAIHDDFHKVFNIDQDSQIINKLNSLLFNDKIEDKVLLNYEIVSAYQGEEGVALVKKSLEEGRPFAMAFVDMLMPPGINGIQAIKRIWEIDKDVQIAICTAYSEYSWEDIIKELGMTDKLLILKKPFDNMEVRQIACCLVNKWNLNQKAGLQIDDIRMILEKRNQETKISLTQLANEKSTENKKLHSSYKDKS